MLAVGSIWKPSTKVSSIARRVKRGDHDDSLDLVAYHILLDNRQSPVIITGLRHLWPAALYRQHRIY